MNILCTGGSGYIGSVLVPLLVREGHHVTVVDTLWFGAEVQGDRLIEGDIRNLQPEWLDDVDAIIHLAGFSNDPMAEADPMMNYVVNAAATANLALAAKKREIRKFIFASSCSTYGFVTGRILSEDYDPKPQFPYAISKLMAERALSALSDESFSPVSLRFGTIGGYSPRMRLDLVINAMTMNAIKKGKIFVHNPSLWRPLVDIRDVAKSFIAALDHEATGPFNILHSNHTVKGMALEVAEAVFQGGFKRPEIEVTRKFDLRSYQADSTRARELLEFDPQCPVLPEKEHDIEDTVASIIDNFVNVCNSHKPDMEDSRYYNVRWLKEKGIL